MAKTRNEYGFSRPNQWEHDKLEEIDGLEPFVEIERHELSFLMRLCRMMYEEPRLTGDQMRNIAQKLDCIINTHLK